MKRESMSRAALIGCLGGIPVAIFYEMFFLGLMRGNIGLALIEAITLAPSGAAAAFLAFHAHQRYGESPGAMLLALLSGVTVAVVAIAVVVYMGSQLGLFDAPALRVGISPRTSADGTMIRALRGAGGLRTLLGQSRRPGADSRAPRSD